MFEGQSKKDDRRRLPADHGRAWRKYVGVPKELIAIRAYENWHWRCVCCGGQSHGYDVKDWLEAEQELERLWSHVTPDDINAFAKEFSWNAIYPSHDCVAKRAYFMALAQVEHSAEQDELYWCEAEREEKKILFAKAFLQFQSQRTHISSGFVRLTGHIVSSSN